ncbi:hypothetical protein PK35_07040 [Tamlana nanhaiensis]|uniref:PpiC domain-containing protein n=1 Tax=Neotamlana nanhaiensis TaxID=1382798 RepID=A0A0D7W6Y1_9FLAO|nr:peptidylprolyl isomerase [Tamlana nanhaiensis]KJD33587.1 hypothetical protein PK35_07040 [Tamlana nanhaiensis]
MKKTLLFLTLTGFTTVFYAQTSTEKELALLETPEQVETFLAEKKSKKNKLITFNEEKHKTILAKELFKLGVGSTKKTENEFETTYFKIIKRHKKVYQRASYIYLDGNTYDKKNLNDLRKLIINKYNNGSAFDFLAKQYSMDGNANKGGDLGWITKGDLHEDFEPFILDDHHEVGEPFTIDIPKNNWYYVAMITEEPKKIVEIEVLKIVEQN